MVSNLLLCLFFLPSILLTAIDRQNVIIGLFIYIKRSGAFLNGLTI